MTNFANYHNVIWTGNASYLLIPFIILAIICIIFCVLNFVTIKIPVGIGAASIVIGIVSILFIIWCSTELFNDQNYHVISIEPATNSTTINDTKVQFSEYIVYIRENEDIIYKFAVNNENIEWFKEKGQEQFTIDRFDLNERIIGKLDGNYVNRNNSS